MKVTYRIPSKGPYGFVEIEEDLPIGFDLNEVVGELERLMALQTDKEAGNGIPQKEFNAAVDRFNLTQQGDTEQYARMSKVQQDWFRVQRNSFTRIKTKNGETIIHQEG